MWTDLNCLQPQKKMLKRNSAFHSFPCTHLFIHSLVYKQILLIITKAESEIFTILDLRITIEKIFKSV